MAQRKKKARKTAANSTARKKSTKIRNSSAHLLRKSVILTTVAVFALWLLSGLASAGLASQIKTQLSEAVLQASATAGFAVGEVTLTGRHHTDAEELRRLLNLEAGAPVFAFSPEKAAARIAKIAWVEDVSIRRRLPDKIEITLTERIPAAVWQHAGRQSVIDRNGIVLAEDDISDFHGLPLLIGRDAAEHAREILTMLHAEPALHPYFGSAARIGGRRWDMILSGGTRVKLPENDPEHALAQMMKLHNQEGILDIDWIHIDLRTEGRVIFKPERHAAANGTQTASTSTPTPASAPALPPSASANGI